MANDGKTLERLVESIETLLLPRGFRVTPNKKIFNDKGGQIAEFDVEIKGKLGSTEIAWLIECRDRPGDGPAPASWIEQLNGRRARFGFNKVTAVSTTGFAGPAMEFAKESGIEIREVKELTPTNIADWLALKRIDLFEQRLFLKDAKLCVSDTESEERQKAFSEALSGKRKDEPLLRSTGTGEEISTLTAFQQVVNSHPELFEGVRANQPPKTVNLNVSYDDEASHFVVDSIVGAIRVRRIVFQGELSIEHSVAALSGSNEYREVGSSTSISQSASFVVPIQNNKFSLELHRLTESGDIHMGIQKLESEGNPD